MFFSVLPEIDISAEIQRNKPEWPEQAGMKRNSIWGGTRGWFVLAKWLEQNFLAILVGAEWN